MWHIVFTDNLKVIIPFKNQVRSVLRHFFPYTSDTGNDELALEQGLEILSLAKDNAETIDTILEFGTGWLPTIPMLFKAAGSKKIYLTDVEPLMDQATKKAALEFVESQIDKVAVKIGISTDKALENLHRPDDIFSYICPFDPASFSATNIDLIYSRTVLEHVPEKLLEGILPNLRKLLSPKGISIHLIDNSDHFQHRNRALSRLNFLKYGRFLWRIACWNQQNYQNRLRHSDYINLFREANYTLVSQSGEPDKQAVKDAGTMPLHNSFKSYKTDDLAILTSWIIAS